MSAPMGFMSGLIEGSQAAQQQSQSAQMSQLAQVKGQQDIQMNQQSIEQTKLMLEKQRQMMLRLATIQKQSASDPQGQMRALATEALNRGQAAMDAGLTEEGLKDAEQGSKLLTGVAKMDKAAAEKQKADAQLMSSLMANVTDSDGFRQAMMIYQAQAGHAAPENILKAGYSPQLVKLLQDTATTKLQQSEIKLREAQEAEARAGVPLKNALTRAATARATESAARAEAIGKAGGKGATKADQRTADAQADVIENIDHMLDQLSTMEDDPTGVKGRYHHFMEFVGSVTGFGSGKTEVTRFQQDVDALQIKLSAALTSRQYRSKDIQNLIKELGDLKSPGTSRVTAAAKLEELKELVRSQLDKGPVRPSGESKVMTLDEYLATQSGSGEE